MPRVAPVLYEFVELDNGEYLKIAEAVFRIFDRQEWLRANRARARIKVFVDKYGIDELRRQVEEELEGRLGRRTRLLDRAPPVPRRRARVARRRRRRATAAPTATSPSSSASVPPTSPAQKQEGFVTVEVKITRGDLSPEQFRGLAQIMRDYAGGYARTTVQQNLVLRWVREESVYDVWRALCELGLGDAGSREIDDVVSCPGTDSCKLGITSSMGLNQAVQERDRGDGHHRRADARDAHQDQRLPQRLRPAPRRRHRLLRARRSKSASTRSRRTSRTSAASSKAAQVKFGTRLKLRLPAKRIPEAIERWIRHYESTARGRRGRGARSSSASAPPSSRRSSRTCRCRSTSDWSR